MVEIGLHRVAQQPVSRTATGHQPCLVLTRRDPPLVPPFSRRRATPISEHVSFRAAKALIDAARRQTGVESITELILAALAMLARPDPVVETMQRTRDSLGPTQTLEY
jgi:hypothetical protein